ncbi:MFS transporter [Patulibacter sp. SYSU D01012]|uniref:MFS transporter n=1 Tax=Patulibacter sp. SYSU D01012 TaxID=2817381 RepID=UPI001B314F2C|nr:MFS transporter [Patulibacter sp. SYSU D01012]
MSAPPAPPAPAASSSPAPPASRPGGWAPLRHAGFRTMWTAQLASNVGGWMQTVGAQWLMLSLSGSAAYLAFIQTAASLPVLLFAVVAGAVGDIVDRRRLLLVSQTAMLAASLLLAALTILDLVTPWVLLALLFAVGSGQAWTSPTWQTLQPELVPAGERPQAIALGAVNQNLARAIGPALGGVLVAATDPSVAFVVNAGTFLVVIVAVARWRGARRAAASALPPEHLLPAVRASGRYVRNSPALRAVLARAGAFVFFASGLWALLPAVAHGPLGLGSGGYGVLLGAVGVGAVVGAGLLPRLRARLAPDVILAGSAVVVGAATLVLARTGSVVAAVVALAFGGVGWILALATLNATYQAMLPAWVKARGLAFYLVVFQGGMAIGSAVLGVVAGSAGLRTTLTVAAIATAVVPLLGLLRPMPRLPADELVPASDAPAPIPTADDAAPAGPVLVTIERYATAGAADELAAAVAGLRRARRRTGASAWSSWQDVADPRRVLEQFVVATWDEHLRQHERITVRDQHGLERVAAHAEPGRAPVITHWAAARGSGR